MRTFLLLTLSLLFMPLSAQRTKQSPREKELLVKLDKIVENKAEYHAEKDKQIARLKEQIERASGQSRILLYKEAFNLYSHYQTDSARVCLDKITQLPEYQTDEELRAYHCIAQAELLSVVTLYGEAIAELQKIPPHLLTAEHPAVRLYYFRTMRTLYGWMADYTKMPIHHKLWEERTNDYRDSLIDIDVPGEERDIVRADKAVSQGNHQEALRLLTPYAKKMKADSPNPYICYTLFSAYQLAGEKDEALYYLILTAISDIKNGTTEYLALPILAQILYKKGDIERAYKYMVCSMEDATFCHAGLRTVEITNIFPIIEKQYKEREAHRRTRDKALLYSFICVSVLLCVSLFYMRKQMRHLHLLRKEQNQTNEQLSAANEKMQASVQSLKTTNEELQQTYANLRLSDKIKEEYIARYLDRCRGYLDALEEYRRTSLRLIKEHKLEELSKSLKSESMIKAEQEKFYADFDAAFLTLFPDFIQKFNALLQPGAEILPKHKEGLNTELRIFALIRLGVTDTQRIAHFLDYSLATVYNYRSKIRNKAYGDPAEFEAKVIEIE